MGTITDKLGAVYAGKKAIKAAINAKAPGEPAGEVFADYPECITSIPTVNLADPVNSRTGAGITFHGSASGGGSAAGYGLVQSVEYRDGLYVIQFSLPASYGTSTGGGTVEVSGTIYLNTL